MTLLGILPLFQTKLLLPFPPALSIRPLSSLKEEFAVQITTCPAHVPLSAYGIVVLWVLNYLNKILQIAEADTHQDSRCLDLTL